jgi:hypothetical protein
LSNFYDDDIERIVVLRQNGSQRRGRVRILGGNNADDGVKVRVLSSSGGRLVRVKAGSAGGKKKQSKYLRPLEKSIRKRMSARSKFSRIYLELHNRSNRRKRNGWLRDWGRNMIKAYRRARD